VVTVVGATDSRRAPRSLVDNLLATSAAGKLTVNLVNRKGALVRGLETVSTIDAVAGDLGILYLLVSPDQCRAVLSGLTDRLPTAVIIYSGGFDETAVGVNQVSHLDWISRWSADTMVPVFGPMSSGFLTPSRDFRGITAPVPAGLSSGPVGIVVQSGGLFNGIVRQMASRGIGLSTGVACGAGAVVDYEAIAYTMLADDEIEVIACYVEALGSPIALRRLGEAVERSGKQLIIAVPGVSDLGQRMAMSHSGAAATSRAVFEGTCEQFGIVAVQTCDELVWGLEALLEARGHSVPMSGVCVVSGSGAASVLVADELTKGSITMPLPSATTVAALAALQFDADNPFDSGPGAFDDLERYGALVSALAADDRYGYVVMVAGVGLPDTAVTAQMALADTFVESVLSRGKVPVISAALSQVRPAHMRWDRTVVSSSLPELRVKLSTLQAAHAVAGRSVDAADTQAEVISTPQDAAPESWTVASGVDAQLLLADLSLAWPASLAIDSMNDLDIDWCRSHFPLIAKAEVGLPHRVMAGALIRGVAAVPVLVPALEYMLARFGGPIQIYEEIDHGDEYFVGYTRTPENGSIVALGIHGTDGIRTSVRSAPLRPDHVTGLVASIAAIDGHRTALERLITELGDFVASRPDISSVDLNPVTFTSEGALIALDAKVFLDSVRNVKTAPSPDS
jgi:acyl-CoA synthetase (NDP forming)